MEQEMLSLNPFVPRCHKHLNLTSDGGDYGGCSPWKSNQMAVEGGGASKRGI